MDKLDFFSVLCGFLAMIAVPIIAMAQGYEGMTFTLPYVKAMSLTIWVEVGLMWWMGAAPGLLVAGMLFPLSKLWWPFEALAVVFFYGAIPVTAVALAFPMMRLMRALVHLWALGAT